MKTQMQMKFEAVLNKTKLSFRVDTKPLQKQVPKVRKGKHALHSYKGVVEYPLSMGGGIAWMKSEYALRNYEDKGCKVVWL